MLDLSFAEIVVIAVVALIVIGPERLPKVARTAGLLLGRVQRYVSGVKSDIQRELQLEELKGLQQKVQDQAKSFEDSMRGQVGEMESALDKTAAEVVAIKDEITHAVTAPALPDAKKSDDVGEKTLQAVVGDETEAQKNDAQLNLGLEPTPVSGKTPRAEAP